MKNFYISSLIFGTLGVEIALTLIGVNLTIVFGTIAITLIGFLMTKLFSKKLK